MHEWVGKAGADLRSTLPARRAALQSQPAVNISEDEARKLTERIQNAGTEVVEAKVRRCAYIMPMLHAFP
jgi:malate/lactate dehydrogenase